MSKFIKLHICYKDREFSNERRNISSKEIEKYYGISPIYIAADSIEGVEASSMECIDGLPLSWIEPKEMKEYYKVIESPKEIMKLIEEAENE